MPETRPGMGSSSSAMRGRCTATSRRAGCDVSEDWQPPTRKLADGGIIFDGWQAIRAAIEAAYAALGRERPSNIPTEDWNLAGLAIDAYAHAQRSSCVNCSRKLWHHETIRCLDCKA